MYVYAVLKSKSQVKGTVKAVEIKGINLWSISKLKDIKVKN